MIEKIKLIFGWFESLGWVANTVTIMTPIVLLGSYVFRNRSNFIGISSASELVQKKVNPNWTKSAFKELVEIAIVDDNQSDFPIPELKKANYRIKGYKHVAIGDVDDLSKYDIVFLDIHGIVKDDPENGGHVLIGKLREINKYQKICAVSSKTFNPSATTFFKKADDVLDKPISAQKCQEVIDTFALEKLSPQVIAQEIDTQMNMISNSNRRKILHFLVQQAKLNHRLIDFEEIEGKVGYLNNDLKLLITDLYRIIYHARK